MDEKGFKLQNAQRQFCTSETGFAALLQFGYQKGWKPAGTRIDHLPADQQPPDWRGNYLVHKGQKVTTEDAAAFAEVIDKALKSSEIALSSRQYLMEFSGFLKQGEFFIQ